MLDQAPFILLGMLLLGVALVALGLRGRRINDHPACAGCGFDLLGVYPGTFICPECGAELSGEKRVRQGVRQRRRGMLVVGGCLLGIAALLVGSVAWLMAAGPSMNKHKPVFVLLMEGRHAGAKGSREAAKELVRRMRDDRLTGVQVRWAVSTAIDLQADLGTPWVSDWGDVVEIAENLGNVEPAVYARFLRQSVVLDCRVRPAVETGGRVPLVVGVSQWRRAAAPTLQLGVWLEGVRVDGEEVLWGYHGERRLALPNSESPLRITSSSWMTVSGPGQGSNDALGLEIDLPARTAEGDADVELLVRISDETGPTAAPISDRELAEVGVRLKRTVRVVSPGVANQLRATSGDTERLRRHLAGSQVRLVMITWGGSGTSYGQATVRVPRSGAPVPFAFDVFVRIGDAEYPAGQVVTGQMPRRGRLGFLPNGSAGDFEGDHDLVAEIPAYELPESTTPECTLVFRPRSDLARLTLDMTEWHASEVIVEGVPMERRPAGAGEDEP